MRLRHGSREMDMTSGSLLPKILLFSLPLIASSILQLLFNAADVVVVGRFGPDRENALAAVGSTGALINLIINIFLGLSVGANVVIARYCGANRPKEASEAVHTSVFLALFGGLFLAVIGFALCHTFLIWMGSPEQVLPLATLYMKIYFLGMPFNMLYNFGAAVLRSIGDTRRPLYYLMIAGIINVALNLFFVIVLNMSVAGVALATILSQGVSATLVFLCLLRSHNVVHLDVRRIRLNFDRLKEIASIGLPAGLQGMCFSLSNVLIQSTINSFGNIVMAGNTTAANLEGFVYVAMNALHQAAVTFTSQNVGAGKTRRVRKVALECALASCAIGLALGGIMVALRYPLMGIYSDEEAVIQAGMIRMCIVVPTYFLCGLMDTLCGVLRGMGSTVTPMIVSVLGACAFRIFWIYAILPMNRTLEMLYLSYPISWILTSAVHAVFCVRKFRQLPPEPQAA